MKTCGIKTKKLSSPITLELGKLICDTSYYGWLISYAQLSNMIAVKNKVNYDEMWLFADEIHKYLGNRPKMFPGIIGGHCVIPNLELVHDHTLNLIKELNTVYKSKPKKLKRIIASKNKHLYGFDHNGLKFDYDADQFLIGTPVILNIDSDDESILRGGGKL